MPSSREWKEITTRRPPGPSTSRAPLKPRSRLPSSSLTCMRMAWKVRVAGWRSRGQAARGIAASTAAARSRAVRRGRRWTMKWAIRYAQRSSPRWATSPASSRSGRSFTTRSAVSSRRRSMRMSRGPSRRMLKPRPGSSSWGLETPRSRSTPSTRSKPASRAISARSAKLPWRSMGAGSKPASRLRAASSAASSRSMPSRRPPGRIRSRTSRACPPRPSVPSTTTAPGRGWRSSMDCCESTGRCPGVSVRSATPLDYPVGELVEPAHRVIGVRFPPLLGPDLHPGSVADDGHGRARLDPGQPALLRAEADAALGIELTGHRLGEERPRQGSLLRPQQRVLQPAGQALPLVGGVDGEDAILPDRDEAAVRELPPERGGHRQAALLVDADPVGAPEHGPCLVARVRRGSRDPTVQDVGATRGSRDRGGGERWPDGVVLLRVPCRLLRRLLLHWLAHHFSPHVTAIRHEGY